MIDLRGWPYTRSNLFLVFQIYFKAMVCPARALFVLISLVFGLKFTIFFYYILFFSSFNPFYTHWVAIAPAVPITTQTISLSASSTLSTPLIDALTYMHPLTPFLSFQELPCIFLPHIYAPPFLPRVTLCLVSASLSSPELLSVPDTRGGETTAPLPPPLPPLPPPLRGL